MADRISGRRKVGAGAAFAAASTSAVKRKCAPAAPSSSHAGQLPPASGQHRIAPLHLPRVNPRRGNIVTEAAQGRLSRPPRDNRARCRNLLVERWATELGNRTETEECVRWKDFGSST